MYQCSLQTFLGKRTPMNNNEISRISFILFVLCLFFLNTCIIIKMRTVFQQFGLVIHVSTHKEYPEWRWYKMFLKWHLMKTKSTNLLRGSRCRMQNANVVGCALCYSSPYLCETLASSGCNGKRKHMAWFVYFFF